MNAPVESHPHGIHLGQQQYEGSAQKEFQLDSGKTLSIDSFDLNEISNESHQIRFTLDGKKFNFFIGKDTPLNKMLIKLQSKTGEDGPSARRAAEILIFKNIETMLDVQEATDPVIATFSKSDVIFSGKDNKQLADKQITLPTNTSEAEGTKGTSASEQLRDLGTERKMEHIFNSVLNREQHYRQTNLQKTPPGEKDLVDRVHVQELRSQTKPGPENDEDKSSVADARRKPRRASITTFSQLHAQQRSQAATVEETASRSLREKSRKEPKASSLTDKHVRSVRKNQNSSTSGAASSILQIAANILRLFQ